MPTISSRLVITRFSGSTMKPAFGVCASALSARSMSPRSRGIGSWVVAAGEPKYELQIAALAPSERRKPLRESGEIALRHRVALRKTHEHPDAPHPLGLLRARRERPRGRRAAKQRDELAALHSISSSARASSVGGTSRPSARAVFRLITVSYLVGCCTGRSAGFAPLRMRST